MTLKWENISLCIQAPYQHQEFLSFQRLDENYSPIPLSDDTFVCYVVVIDQEEMEFIDATTIAKLLQHNDKNKGWGGGLKKGKTGEEKRKGEGVVGKEGKEKNGVGERGREAKENERERETRECLKRKKVECCYKI